jgi:hypothetical protein
MYGKFLQIFKPPLPLNRCSIQISSSSYMLFCFLKRLCYTIWEPISSGIHLQNLLVCINEHRKLKSMYVEWHLIACDVQFNNPAATRCIALNDRTVNTEQEWKWRWMQSVLRYYPDRCQRVMLKPVNTLVIISLHCSGTNSFIFTEQAVTGWTVICVADIPIS